MPISAVLGRVAPVAVAQVGGDDFLYTFPKNFVGTVEIAPLPDAAAGSQINLQLGEWLSTKNATPVGGLTYPKISSFFGGGWDVQTEDHVLRAGKTEPITTLFCWHGFQYVRVQLPGNLSTGFKGGLNDIVGLEIHTNMTQTGHLEFHGGGDASATQAAAVLSGVNQMTLQSQRTNVAGASLQTHVAGTQSHRIDTELAAS
jgi:hypothetical protein